MSCCTNTYDLGCHSHCDLLELSDIQWPSTGTFCFVSTFAGNPVSWEQDGVNGENIELSMQLLNEDGESTFYIKDSNGNILTFDIGGTDYDCFKITAYPAGCGNTDFTTVPVTCSSAIGVNCQIPYWDYTNQEWDRLSPGTNGQVLGVVGTCIEWVDQSGGGGGITSLTGDVTAAGAGAVAATIANDAVTFAKMQNIATDKILGRDTAGSGNVEELGVGNMLQLLSGNLEIGDLTKNTSIWQAAFNLLFGGTPEAGKQVEYDSGPDLFKLNAHHGLPAINGAGIRYMMTFDGIPVTGYPLGKPTSWFFIKTSNDTPVGGDYLASLGYFNVLTGKEAYWEATENGVRGVIVTAGGDETIGRASDTGGWEFIGKDNTAANHALTALDSLGANLFSTRNDGLIELKGSTIDPTDGNNGDVLTSDGAGGWTMQAPTGGGGILQNVWIDKTIVSAVGSGYSFATPNYFNNYITIPANTLQSGDYLIIKSGGQRTGTGNAAFFTGIVNTIDSSAIGTQIGQHGANFGSYVGTNFSLFCGAAGVYLMPNGGNAAAVPPVDEFATGGAGTVGTGYTQIESGNTINYANPLYIQNWAIAANTSTIYSKFILVEHYRP